MAAIAVATGNMLLLSPPLNFLRTRSVGRVSQKGGGIIVTIAIFPVKKGEILQ
jgi:hypothetical protein